MKPSSSETKVRVEKTTRAHHDRSKWERGRYAHLFGEVTADEDLVADFWRSLGVEVKRFAGSEEVNSRHADFELYLQGQRLGLCEVKSLDRAGHGVIADRRRVSNAVYSAARLLTESNPEHEGMNVLVLVDRQGSAAIGELDEIVSGEWNPLTGGLGGTPRFIRDMAKVIDMYLWMEATRDGSPRMVAFRMNPEAPKRQSMELLLSRASAIKTVA
jgi:hypothetical protein